MNLGQAEQITAKQALRDAFQTIQQNSYGFNSTSLTHLFSITTYKSNVMVSHQGSNQQVLCYCIALLEMRKQPAKKKNRAHFLLKESQGWICGSVVRQKKEESFFQRQRKPSINNRKKNGKIKGREIRESERKVFFPLSQLLVSSNSAARTAAFLPPFQSQSQIV